MLVHSWSMRLWLAVSPLPVEKPLSMLPSRRAVLPPFTASAVLTAAALAVAVREEVSTLAYLLG
eukprot:6173203-Pleurochrysis_carterae.AAC.1